MSQCAVTGRPNQTGQISWAARSQTVNMKSSSGAPGATSSSQLLLRKPSVARWRDVDVKRGPLMSRNNGTDGSRCQCRVLCIYSMRLRMGPAKGPRPTRPNTRSHSTSQPPSFSIRTRSTVGHCALGRRAALSAASPIGEGARPGDRLHVARDWRCRNDPYHQRGVRERLISRTSRSCRPSN